MYPLSTYHDVCIHDECMHDTGMHYAGTHEAGTYDACSHDACMHDTCAQDDNAHDACMHDAYTQDAVTYEASIYDACKKWGRTDEHTLSGSSSRSLAVNYSRCRMRIMFDNESKVLPWFGSCELSIGRRPFSSVFNINWDLSQIFDPGPESDCGLLFSINSYFQGKFFSIYSRWNLHPKHAQIVCHFYQEYLCFGREGGH